MPEGEVRDYAEVLRVADGTNVLGTCFFLKSGWILLLQSCYPAIPGYLMGCTYLDFEQYIADHPDCSVVEMDIVEGPDGL